MSALFKKEEKKVESTIFKIDLNPQIPSIPEIEDKTKVNIRYPLMSPYVNAHIFWDSSNQELVYEIEEPKLTENEKVALKTIEEGLKELINISYIGMQSSDVVIEYLEKNVSVLIQELNIKLNEESFLKLMYYIYRDFIGLNEIEPLLHDYFIEDIECNGLDFPVYIVHRIYKNLRTNVIYKNLNKLTTFVEKLAQKCGKYISYASPLLDGSLPDGSRVNATYTQEISARGPTFTIRKFTKIPWTPIKLMQMRTVSPEILAYLWLLIEHESNIMVMGGAGSGKTTFLNALAFFVPPQARIVSIEDTRELNILHGNWLPSVARAGAGFTPGKKQGEISLFDLLKESFRQRPDYVIVGEVRGREAYVLFQGMSAGHPSFGTMHAEDVDTMVRRLETPPINLSPSLVESLDVVCVMTQTKVQKKAIRRLKEIVEIVSAPDVGKITKNSPFKWDPRSDTFFFKTDSKVFDKLITQKGISREELANEFRLRTQLLLRLYQNNIVDFKRVQDIINAYYIDPQRVLRQFGLK